MCSVTGTAGKVTGILFFLCLLLLFCPSLFAREEHLKNVLVLNSYHSGFTHTDDIIEGIENILQPEENNIELRIEYMDTKTMGYETEYKERLVDFYTYKYGNTEFDLIISTDDNAFNFLLEYHYDLFPGVPAVFCGVNNLDAPDLIDRDIFTGIIEIVSVKETIEIAMRLHPETRQIVFVVDNTPTGESVWNQIKEQSEYFEGIQFTRIGDGISMTQIEDEVGNLSDDAIVLFGPYNRDNTGNYISSQECASLVSEASVRPVYGYTDLLIHSGIVGGKLFGEFHHGQNTAEIAQRILNGENVCDVQVIEICPSQYMFNYEQLERWNIELSELPEGSIVINEPEPSFYEKYYRLIWSIAVFISLETLILLGLIVNVSKRKKAEKALRKQQDELEELVSYRTADLEATNRELEAFAYSVSHDLRAPLRGIDGFSHAFLEEYSENIDDKGKDYLKRIRAGAHKMDRLIDDLLKLSRLSRSEMRYDTVDMSAFAIEIAEDLRQTDTDRNVEFVISPSISAHGDATLLKIALINLLSNAWKFTGNHEHARIEVGVENIKNDNVYFVRDDGAGFNMKYVEKLFGVFQRLHGTTEFSGNGIGLATVQRIIRRHGGKIWAESEVEKGATFYFTLPKQNS